MPVEKRGKLQWLSRHPKDEWEKRQRDEQQGSPIPQGAIAVASAIAFKEYTQREVLATTMINGIEKAIIPTVVLLNCSVFSDLSTYSS